MIKNCKKHTTGNTTVFAGIALALMAAAFVGFLTYLNSQQTESVILFLDNGTNTSYTWQRDESSITIPPHSAVKVKLPVGEHSLVLQGPSDDDRVETKITLKSSSGVAERKWLYNIKDASQYTLYEIAFGNAKTESPKPFETSANPMELESAATLFLPVEKSSTKGAAGTTQYLIGHSEVHENQACCENLLEIISKN